MRKMLASAAIIGAMVAGSVVAAPAAQAAPSVTQAPPVAAVAVSDSSVAQAGVEIWGIYTTLLACNYAGLINVPVEYPWACPKVGESLYVLQVLVL